MKKTHFYFLLMLFMGILTACSDSDESTNGNYDSSQFVGEWCSINGTSATIWVMNNITMTGEVYVNLATTPSLYETLSGPWVYYANNNVLQMSIMHSHSGHQTTNSYKVLKAGNGMLQLQEQNTGSVDDYYKLVGNITVGAGESTSLSYGDFKPVGYLSSNTSIATVDENGVLAAKSQGVVFISMYSDDMTVIFKVNVKGRVENYEKELFTTIDDVMAKRGTPDASGTYQQNSAILYNSPSFDTALSNVQYQYDENTREISRILTVYKSYSDYNSDRNFIISNYIDHGYNMYGIEQDYDSNKFLISPFTNSGVNYVSYNNQQYHDRTGHY